MKALELSVESIATSVTDQVVRQRCIELLEGMAKDCGAAADLWSNYMKQAGPAPQDPTILMNWTGAEMAKALFDLHLGCRAKEIELTQGRSTLEEPIIVLAYRKLNEGESGPAAAQAAVTILNAHVGRLQAMAEMIRTTVPKKAAKSAPAATAKRAAAPAAKSAKKPTAKKAPAAKKKPAAKAKKSPAKKSAPKKKPARKKSGKPKPR